jgi:Fe-S cluster biosynthesis and repair protein YggX
MDAYTEAETARREWEGEERRRQCDPHGEEIYDEEERLAWEKWWLGLQKQKRVT